MQLISSFFIHYIKSRLSFIKKYPDGQFLHVVEFSISKQSFKSVLIHVYKPFISDK